MATLLNWSATYTSLILRWLRYATLAFARRLKYTLVNVANYVTIDHVTLQLIGQGWLLLAIAGLC